MLSVLAATYANTGINPLTEEKVFTADVVKSTLSILYSCGLYNHSGQFSFEIGIPAKSSKSGAIMIVIPGVCGICVWSPRLNEMGNSVRGLEFTKRLGKELDWH